MPLINFKDYEKQGMSFQDAEKNSMHFQILNLEQSSKLLSFENKECAVLLIQGEAEAIFHGEKFSLKRGDWKNENPSVFHLSCCEELNLQTKTQARFAIITTENSQKFSSKFYSSKDVALEHRGKGILEDTCYRYVRTVFDFESAPRESKLVLGEVITQAGRWSSYPPHHHDQDELYYYEFSPQEGFGFGQCGDGVYTVKDKDLLHIPGGKDHAQVSAPGYTMYYIWVIRHGERPYRGFEYTKPYDQVLS